jgi:DNA-binding MarR family transcriptional regulator
MGEVLTEFVSKKIEGIKKEMSISNPRPPKEFYAKTRAGINWERESNQDIIRRTGVVISTVTRWRNEDAPETVSSGLDWTKLDWSKGDDVLAEENNRAVNYVREQRRIFGNQIDFSSLNWDRGDDYIMEVTGWRTSEYAQKMRKLFAPHTIRKDNARRLGTIVDVSIHLDITLVDANAMRSVNTVKSLIYCDFIASNYDRLASMTDLTIFLDVSTAATTGITDTLLENGYIIKVSAGVIGTKDRFGNTLDRRKIYADLTEKGRDLVASWGAEVKVNS